MAVADASFSTVNDSISLGFTIERGFAMPAPPSSAMGTPSITISGALDAVSDAIPRMRIVGFEFGPPSPGMICTPGTLPCIISCAETTAPRLFSSALMATTEPVMSFFLTAP